MKTCGGTTRHARAGTVDGALNRTASAQSASTEKAQTKDAHQKINISLQTGLRYISML